MFIICVYRMLPFHLLESSEVLVYGILLKRGSESLAPCSDGFIQIDPPSLCCGCFKRRNVLLRLETIQEYDNNHWEIAFKKFVQKGEDMAGGFGVWTS